MYICQVYILVFQYFDLISSTGFELIIALITFAGRVKQILIFRIFNACNHLNFITGYGNGSFPISGFWVSSWYSCSGSPGFSWCSTPMKQDNRNGSPLYLPLCGLHHCSSLRKQEGGRWVSGRALNPGGWFGDSCWAAECACYSLPAPGFFSVLRSQIHLCT